MVERGGLENRCARKSTQGSNPCLSAICTNRLVLKKFSTFSGHWVCTQVQKLVHFRMRKSLSKCVFQRKNGVFYFRRAVPKDLVSRVGQREWKASLGTRNEQEAHTLAADHFRRTEQRIRVMRGQHLAKEEKTGTQSYTAVPGFRCGRL